jgi:hypothetical protein
MPSGLAASVVSRCTGRPMRQWVVVLGGVGLNGKLFAVDNLGLKLSFLAKLAAARLVIIYVILPCGNLMQLKDGDWAVAEWILDETPVDGLQIGKQVPVEVPAQHAGRLHVLGAESLEEVYSLSIVDWEPPGEPSRKPTIAII